MNARPPCYRARLIALLIITFTAITVPVSKAASAFDTFIPTSSMSAARMAHTATLLQDGTVLVAGGYTTNNTMLTAAELYDHASGTWKTTGPMSTGRMYHTATLLYGGKVLVTGGYTYRFNGQAVQSEVLGSAELYNPADKSWSSAGDMHSVRMGHTATLLPSGKVLIVGGGFNNSVLPELYDPATNSWNTTGTELTNYNSHTATLLPNGKVLITGGSTGVFESAFYTDSARLYDPATESWAVTHPMGSPRHNHTATLLADGKVLVVGTNTPGRPETYDPATQNWSFTVPLKTARQGNQATLLTNGKVLVTGGIAYNSDHGPNSELYNPAAPNALTTWTPVGADKTTLTSRRRHTATLLPDGRVLVAGGITVADNVLATCQVYQPDVEPLTTTAFYTGLVKAMDGTVIGLGTEGSFTALLMANGAFSGRLVLNGEVRGIVGSFDVEGVAHFGPAKSSVLTIERRPRPSYTIELTRDLSQPPASVAITGTVSQHIRSVVTAVSTINAGHAIYDARTPGTTVPAAYLASGNADGIFHVMMPAIAATGSNGQATPQTPGFTTADFPQGTGIAAVRITRAGVVTFSGMLADGTPVSATTRLTLRQSTGEIAFPLFVQLYGRSGFISADLTLDNTRPDSDFSVGDNYVYWARPPLNTYYYPYGWPEVIVTGLVGSKFTVTPGQSVIPGMPAPSPTGNGVLETFSEAELTPPGHAFNISPTDAVVSAPPFDSSFTLGINRAAGRFGGTFYIGDGTRPTFRGIIYQKGTLTGGQGFYLTKPPRIRDYNGKSGLVRLRAAELK